jgi:hypothetical protein
MPKTMHAGVVIDMPADEFKEAETKLLVKPAWDAFLKALADAGITHKSELVTTETRAKAATNGARRGRKPRDPAAGAATAATTTAERGS